VRTSQALLLAGLLLGACRAPREDAVGAREAPIAIFDGASLAGWSGDARSWRVEGGAIVGESTADAPLAASSWLVWEGGTPQDFELEFEFRVPRGNSGVEFRAARGPDGQVRGLQADFDAEERFTGGLYEQSGAGRGPIAPAGTRVRAGPDGALATVGAAAQPRAAQDGWRSYRVEARGPRVRLWIDGELTAECFDGAPGFTRPGHIALQLHGGAPARVEVRDLALRELAGPLTDLSDEPRWIWCDARAGSDQRAWFTREFELAAAPLAARLEIACDNAFEVRVNGTSAFAGDDWSRPVAGDVAQLLSAGPNRIEVAARNAGGPAGLALALDWELGAHGAGRLVSDGRWRAHDAAPAPGDTGRPALEIGVAGDAPWGTPGAPTAPAPEGALPGEELSVAEGYAAELVYSVPRALQGSWVSLCFDARGRALASAERGGLYRLTLPGQAGGAVAVELVDDELGGAQGLLAQGNDLYLVTNPRGEHAGGLWRLRDADGDDRYEARELLLPLEGEGEHGPHAVIAHGERLLLVAGNHTPLPKELARSRVPGTWAEDQLFPLREDPNGHAWGIPAPGGWVVSLDRDGGDIELVAAGMRNAYDLALGPEDELFTYDSDMEWDVGLPWYRAPRVIHLASGADFGWRRGSGKWPMDWPDTLPSVVETDLASPVGVLYGAELSAFAGRERAALFLGDWAYGRVLALDLEPRGASWGGTLRPFLSGTPLPVTDLAAGPDGCLYVTIGGRNTQSGLYRVRPLAEQVADAAPSWSGAEQRERRRALERAHLVPDDSVLDEAWRALGADDPFLRNAGRVALEGLPAETWIARLSDEREPRAVVQAAIALAHAGDVARAGEASRALAALPLEALEDDDLVGVLRALALVELRLGGVPEPERGALRTRLEALPPRNRARAERELVRLLVALDSEVVAQRALPWIESPAGQDEELFHAFQLVEARAGWDAESRARFLRLVDAAPEHITGGHSVLGYLAGLRADAHARLGDGTLPEATPALPVLVPPARPFVRDWQVAELVDAGPELEHGRDFERGRTLFREATCFACHRVRGEGGGTGPDLTGAGSRFALRDLLEAVLEPSAVISDQYREMELVTTADELFVGRAVADRGDVVRLLKLPPDERVVEIPRAEVAELRPHALSRMPEGLVDGLEREELLDLLAFLRAGGDPRAAAFRAAAAR
jgi:putative heme-binding domain-containing protein